MGHMQLLSFGILYQNQVLHLQLEPKLSLLFKEEKKTNFKWDVS